MVVNKGLMKSLPKRERERERERERDKMTQIILV
jgi:hypothetical protein